MHSPFELRGTRREAMIPSAVSPSTSTAAGWPAPGLSPARASTTWRRPRASRTGRSRSSTSTRWPAPSSRPAPTGGTTTSAPSAVSACRSHPAAPSPRRRRAKLAEVAVAARDLDGAVDVTLTTGSTRAPDRGALYVAQCAQAVKEASGLPVEIQFEPPEDLDVIDQRPRRVGRRHCRASTSRRSTRPCWSGSLRPRPAPASRATSRPGSGRWRSSVRARSRPTSSSAWVRTLTSSSRVPARHRRRGLPLRRAAAAGGRKPHGRLVAPRPDRRRAHRPPRWPPTSRAAASARARRRPGARAATPAPPWPRWNATSRSAASPRSPSPVAEPDGDRRPGRRVPPRRRRMEPPPPPSDPHGGLRRGAGALRPRRPGRA